MSARQLVLENQMGQRVRTFAIEGDEMSLIYRFDTRRVEGHTDLTGLDESNIDYKVLKTVRASEMSEKGLVIVGMGRLRLSSADDRYSPTFELAEEDDQKTMILVLVSYFLGRHQDQPEPQLVTVIPQHQEVPVEKKQTVTLSEKKIVPQKA